MDSEPLVIVDDVWKTYPGGVTALRGISLRVPRGAVYGLVGPNGAGKTTLLRILATLIKPSRGRVVVDGVDVVEEPFEARKRIAYVPEEVGGYRRLTGLEYLEFIVKTIMAARGAPREEAERTVSEAVKITGLSMDQLSKPIGEYSKGMKRRLQVAWALAVRPSLALLDEPTTGLDVEASYELRETIKRYAEGYGVTVILSSHNMVEVEKLCSRVAVVRRGRLLAEGTPREIMEKTGSVSLEEAYMKLVKGEKD